jgi:hypothetical protein
MMMKRTLLASFLVLLMLGLTAAPAQAIYNCYDYVFYKLTGLDAHPPDPAQRSPEVGQYGPSCLASINNLACVEAALNKKGNYETTQTDTTQTPLPRLAPGDVIYLPIGHVIYADQFNYDRDPNSDMTPKDRPMLSHFLPIPYGVYHEYMTINTESLSYYRYGMRTGRGQIAGGYSAADSFTQLLSKERLTSTSYTLYKKKRLDLLIEVRDEKDKPLQDAVVTLGGADHRTGVKGAVLVELDPDTYRDKDTAMTITKTGFVGEKRTLPAFLMKPSGDFISYAANLTKRDLKDIIDELTKQLQGKRGELTAACSALIPLDKARYDNHTAYNALVQSREKLQAMTQQASTGCAKLAALRAQVRSLAAAVQSKSTRLQALIDQANAIDCKTQADLAKLEALWKQIHPLSWDIYYSAIKAEDTNRKIQSAINEANAVVSRFDTPSLDTPVPLSAMPAEFRKILDSSRTHRDSALRPAYDKVKTARSECVKAHDEAPATLQKSAAALGLQSDPRIATFKTSVASLKPRAGSPCDEESIKKGLDQLILALEKDEQPFKQKVENIRKIPLCNGQTAEDAEIAKCKTSTSVLQNLADSHLIVKRDNCKASLAGSPQTPLPGPRGTTRQTPPSGRVPMHIEGPLDIKGDIYIGDKMTFKAVIDDPRYASVWNRPDGGYAFYWSVGGKARGGKSNSETVQFLAQTEGSHTLAVQFAWANVKTGGPLVPLGDATKQVVIKKPPEVTYNASPGGNSLTGSNKTRGFGDSKEVDVWVPFSFNVAATPGLISAKVIMVVKPIEQLIGTDQFVMKGASGKGVAVFSAFESLKAKQWNTKEINISDADVLAALKRGGNIECVIQDDTAVQSVKLIISYRP